MGCGSSPITPSRSARRSRGLARLRRARIRSIIVAYYIALAIAAAVAFGLHGFLVLLFFYLWAVGFVIYMLAWGAGRA
jgi:hypothetical protein